MAMWQRFRFYCAALSRKQKPGLFKSVGRYDSREVSWYERAGSSGLCGLRACSRTVVQY